MIDWFVFDETLTSDLHGKSSIIAGVKCQWIRSNFCTNCNSEESLQVIRTKYLEIGTHNQISKKERLIVVSNKYNVCSRSIELHDESETNRKENIEQNLKNLLKRYVSSGNW